MSGYNTPGIKGFQPRPLRERFDEKVDRSGECWIWKGAHDAAGYGDMGRDGRAHRVSYALAFGPIPPGMWVLHRCDNPPCVRPEHLFLGTHQDNMDDMNTKGRNAQPRGEAHSAAKLSDLVVREMRQARARGEGLRAIARRIGISHQAAGAAIHGKTWRRVE